MSVLTGSSGVWRANHRWHHDWRPLVQIPCEAPSEKHSGSLPLPRHCQEHDCRALLYSQPWPPQWHQHGLWRSWGRRLWHGDWELCKGGGGGHSLQLGGKSCNGLSSLSGVHSSLLQPLLMYNLHTFSPLELIPWRSWICWVHFWLDCTVTGVVSTQLQYNGNSNSWLGTEEWRKDLPGQSSQVGYQEITQNAGKSCMAKNNLPGWVWG